MKTFFYSRRDPSTKNFILFLFTLLPWLFTQKAIGQPVYNGDVTFTSQAEVDAWLPTYTSITGSLSIEGADITDLTPLQNITSVGLLLYINENAILTSLTGLDAISFIGLTLIIRENPLLTNLIGLGAVTSFGNLGGYIEIRNNASLTTLMGLGPITSLEGYIVIENNPVLSNLSALNAITNMASLIINNNDALTDLTGLNAVTSVDGIVFIQNNASLNSLTGFNALASIGAGFQIYNNDNLMTLTGLDAISSIGGEFVIEQNDVLVSLTGLASLTFVGGALQIQSNASLTSLTGLDILSSIGENLSIGNNTALTSLVGLESLASVVANFYITDNPTLSNCCAVYDLLNTPGAIGGIIIIQNNQTGCDSQEEINAVCSCPDADYDGLCDDADNCSNMANPYQEDADCDGVGDVCDLCPGGDDLVDNNNDGLPDCKYPPAYAYIIPAWKCGNNKVYVCHNSNNTLCINKNALAAHIAHGDYLGPCHNTSCPPLLPSPNEDPNHQFAVEGEMQIEDLNLTTNELHLYPNPARCQLSLVNNEYAGKKISITVVNNLGVILLRQEVEAMPANVMTLELSGFQDGLYFLSIKADGFSKVTKRFVIMRQASVFESFYQR